MPRVLNRPVATRPSRTPAEQLRATMAALRVTFCWFGVRKSLTPEQRSQAAESFGAEGQFLSAGKKLLDTKHPAYRTLGGVKHAIVTYWHSFEDHEKSHADKVFTSKFAALAAMCSETKELGYDMLWQGSATA